MDNVTDIVKDFLENKAPAVHSTTAIQWLVEHYDGNAEELYWNWRREWVRDFDWPKPEQVQPKKKKRQRAKVRYRKTSTVTKEELEEALWLNRHKRVAIGKIAESMNLSKSWLSKQLQKMKEEEQGVEE